MYIPKEFITEELCKIAVRRNSDALDFVPKELRTEELYKIAVVEKKV